MYLHDNMRITTKVNMKEKTAKIIESIQSGDIDNNLLKKEVITNGRTFHTSMQTVNKLCDYLSTKWQDTDAWMALAQIYEQKQQFINAIYCYEEMLLIEPGKPELLVKLSELHFTVGKVDNLLLARKYLSFVLNINGLALRPLLDLLRVCELLKCLQKNDMNDKMIRIINAKLHEIYSSSQVAESVKGIY